LKRVFLLLLNILLIAEFVVYSADKDKNIPLKVFTLHETDITDCEKQLDENEVFFKTLTGFEMDDQGNLYYLECNYATIYKVDMNSGKLLKTISSRGQGPGQLNRPTAMTVKKGKIFVLDIGFGGIKVFDTDGKCLKEFRVGNANVYSISLFLNQIIAANDNNEIFVRELDEKDNTVISVFDSDGKRLKSIIPINAQKEKDLKLWVLNTDFVFKIDKNGDLILLYKKKGELKKYDCNGKLSWERNLYSDLPVQDKNKEKFEVVNKKHLFQVSMRFDFLGFGFTEAGDIFVSTYRGGIYYDKSGNPLFILKQPSGESFGDLFVWNKDDLITPYKIFRLKDIKGGINVKN